MSLRDNLAYRVQSGFFGPGTETVVAPQPARPPDVSIVVPTFQEKGNVSALVERLETVLAGRAWEVVFVDDDSRDGTLDELLALSRRDHRVRFLHRIGRRGLSSAVVEGMLSTNAPYIAVMDADLQHDESRLAEMLALLETDVCDLVVGSRYIGEGSVGDWDAQRQAISRTATRLAQWILPVPLSDPMSGFFMISRDAFMQAVRGLSSQGYKILLDLVMSSPRPPRVEEVPYTFRNRTRGDSKLDSAVVVDYLVLLLDKTVGHVVPARFILFAAVGGLGVFVHMAVLASLLAAGGSFAYGQAGAALVAMASNFFVNNALTYRDKRLKGFGAMARGLASFCAVCSLGAASNVGVAAILFERHYAWWLSAIAGILVGVVWNYALTSVFTWRK